MINSLRDEIEFLLSGKTMPYQKVAFMIAIVCTVFFTVTLGNNVVHEAPVAVIDLDNSKYSHELTEAIDASPFMQVKTILYTPVDAKTLFYNDKYLAAIVLPKIWKRIAIVIRQVVLVLCMMILTVVPIQVICDNI